MRAGSQHGAGYVLINPLHAANPVKPMEPSLYLLTSRRYVNPLYLRVEAIPEFALLAGKRRPVHQLRAKLTARPGTTDTIDRDAAWEAKRAALETGLRRSAVSGP